MEQKINESKRRALHNADTAFTSSIYLAHSFPTQSMSRSPMARAIFPRGRVSRGQPVQSRTRRAPRPADRKARIAAAVHGALDQIVQRWHRPGGGSDGRSRRDHPQDRIRRD